MYRVVLTVDCRNSVCRNSVCLPVEFMGKFGRLHSGSDLDQSHGRLAGLFRHWAASDTRIASTVKCIGTGLREVCLWYMHAPALRSLYETAVQRRTCKCNSMMSADAILVSDAAQRRNNPARRRYPTYNSKLLSPSTQWQELYTIAVGYLDRLFRHRVPDGKVFSYTSGTRHLS